MFDYKSSDIDWFCFINGCPIHVASNGGELPYNLYTDENFISAFNAVRTIEPIYGWAINQEFVNSRHESYNYLGEIEKEERDSFLLPEFIERKEYGNLSLEQIAYSWSFIEMAKRGFFSFDRVDENRYRLIAYPKIDQNEIPRSYHYPLKSLYNNSQFFSFKYGYRRQSCYLFRHYKKTRFFSTTKHLVSKEPFSFDFNNNIDLIDIINSLQETSVNHGSRHL